MPVAGVLATFRGLLSRLAEAPSRRASVRLRILRPRSPRNGNRFSSLHKSGIAENSPDAHSKSTDGSNHVWIHDVVSGLSQVYLVGVVGRIV